MKKSMKNIVIWTFMQAGAQKPWNFSCPGFRMVPVDAQNPWNSNCLR